ncbi:hypothetical protein C7447_10283 [Tenacibaculum adriaticum]|uniref:Uncharacterized protein n=1 Tax=Tenacibaculum adriaticum TaxID=413713 RepID=A0A5S5DTS3_9FLAO|nr:hypothetical protein [Tenacibaculum adriaticum]TYP98768.1 hypothetical protein C7447_10283 [Tenacibaculum adriaticum]
MRTNQFTIKLKYLLIFALFLTFQNIISQNIEDKVVSALSDTTIEIRGKLQMENEKFRFDYHDLYQKDSQAKFLQEKGYHGGGPSWLGIIYGAFKMCDSDLIDNIEMKVEVTGITFWSAKKEELDKIGRVVSVLKSDETILLEAIEYAKEYDMML